MKLTYHDKVYECVSVEKKPNEIVIRTGKFEYDEEIIYQILGDIDFDAVTIEGGEWTREVTEGERIAELDEALELLLSGVTE